MELLHDQRSNDGSWQDEVPALKIRMIRSQTASWNRQRGRRVIKPQDPSCSPSQASEPFHTARPGLGYCTLL